MGNLRLFERYKSLATDAGIQIQKRAIVDIFLWFEGLIVGWFGVVTQKLSC